MSTTRSAFVSVVFFLATLLLVSCGDMYDTIDVSSNGDVHFTTRVVVKENISAKELDEIFRQISTDLNARGWRVSHSLGKGAPVEVVVRGKGNIRTVAPSYVVGAGPVYKIVKLSNTDYDVFLNSIGGPYKRFVKFESSLLSSAAKVTDADGKVVNNLEIAGSAKTVRIVLK